MKVYLGADHRGFNLKGKIKNWLSENKFSTDDLGAFSYDPNDDYPLFAEKVANSVSSDINKGLESRGIVICGSGVGVDIVANKFKHIRNGLPLNLKHITQTPKKQ